MYIKAQGSKLNKNVSEGIQREIIFKFLYNVNKTKS